ncbi:hypothetical protein SteCoe_5694 [Stentor coeruleus]|uniref:Uncharacterized protein n=1 Tax=Stentor coeruleus TaxID=5963 RepID=A0A1R2CRQ2_9CILI|nr:hypothetical protein SteCoe_5694 [Stentor coeruleus]
MDKQNNQDFLSYLKEVYQCIYSYETIVVDDFFAHEHIPDVNALSPEVILMEIKDNLRKLLKFKADFTILDEHQIEDMNNKLEKKIQNKESEVRTCIKTKNELEVKTEDLKWKTEELNLNQLKNKNTIQKLQTCLQCMKLPKKLDQLKIREDMDHKIKDIDDHTEKTSIKILNIEAENQKLQALLDEKSHEIKKMQREKRLLTQKCFQNQSLITEESTDLEIIPEMHTFNSVYKPKIIGYKSRQVNMNNTSLEDAYSLEKLLSSPDEICHKNKTKVLRKTIEINERVLGKCRSLGGLQRKSSILGIASKAY